MFNCVLDENIHESLYDICENIHDNMCYCECNRNKEHLLLVEDLINFIDDRIDSISAYDMNNILVWFGIDNAVKKYNEYYLLTNIDVNNFSKSLLTFLVIISFKVEEDHK